MVEQPMVAQRRRRFEMAADRIEQEIVIEAPPEVVWELVTNPEHIGAWFGDAAEIDLRPGGDAAFSWEAHGRFLARVEKVEPPRFFSYRWSRPKDTPPAEGNSTLVEFSLSAEGGGTRLTVVESGFAALDRSEDEKASQLADNTEGWTIELGHLREYAEHVRLRAS
jgi:uncharacterized protein YndB with AHSA1/START domain